LLVCHRFLSVLLFSWFPGKGIMAESWKRNHGRGIIEEQT
jgi:hypothetical protein